MTNNFFPTTIERIHLMGICGTGMASLAGLLKEQGFCVCGSDANVYPPMSDELKKQDIPVFSPYTAENLHKAKPDLVIVGNVIQRINPEAEALLTSNIPYVSMPQALHHFFLKNKEVIVVSGTHGKTTTTSLLAFLLDRLGQDPSYLIGGVSQNFGRSFHIGQGPHFVIEGDEYDTAFFDKGPKFLHYNPKHVIMTSLEFDHADIYRDLAHVTESFNRLADIIPKGGTLHYCRDYSTLNDVANRFFGWKRTYGFGAASWRVSPPETTSSLCHFQITAPGNSLLSIISPLFGRHNALNIASCFSVLEKLGLSLSEATAALKEFKGIKRRQEVLYEDCDLTVIDDFAHHPTAVNETIGAVRAQYPNHHLIAIFEPRSNTTIRDIFQEQYAKSFAGADEAILAPVFNPQKIKDGKILNVERLVSDLNKNGVMAHHGQSAEAIIRQIIQHTKRPLAILIMSNGSFDNIHRRLIDTWKNKTEK